MEGGDNEREESNAGKNVKKEVTTRKGKGR